MMRNAMKDPVKLQVLYLTPEQLLDALFLRALGQELLRHRHPQWKRLIVFDIGAIAGLPVEAQFLVERVARESAQRVAATLIDNGVSALVVHGDTRGLLKQDQNRVYVHQGEWLMSLMQKDVVPVLSPLVQTGGGPLPVSVGGVIHALESYWKDIPMECVHFTPDNQAGIYQAGKRIPSLAKAEANEYVASICLQVQMPVRVTNLQETFRNPGEGGTLII